jgi:hypothetical protein
MSETFNNRMILSLKNMLIRLSAFKQNGVFVTLAELKERLDLGSSDMKCLIPDYHDEALEDNWDELQLFLSSASESAEDLDRYFDSIIEVIKALLLMFGISKDEIEELEPFWSNLSCP